MPQYLSRKDNIYYLRQAVSAELRKINGKREIKKSLGCDFVCAFGDCKRFTVEADHLISDARTQLDLIPIDQYSAKGIRRARQVPIT
jgi:hypothetical protein